MSMALLVIGALYLLVVLLLTRSPLRDELHSCSDRELSFDLVVVARDEAERLPRFWQSLLRQERRGCRLTLHLVDDCSRDGTPDWLEKQIADAPFPVRLHRSVTHRGKVAQLRALLPSLTAEVVLLTDADCRLPGGWLQTLRRWYDRETGVLGGGILPEGGSRFHELDWLLLSGWGAALADRGNAQSGFGGNLAIDRRTLTKLDYAATIQGDAAEDVQLVQQARRGGLPVSIRLQPELLVRTAAVGWRRYLQQKRRWLAGFRYLKHAARLGVFAFVALQLIAALSVIHFALFWPLWLTVTSGNLLLAVRFSRQAGSKPPRLQALVYPFYCCCLLAGLAAGAFLLPRDWERE